MISRVFPSGFSAETLILERFRAVSAEKHSFRGIPGRFQPINRQPKRHPYPEPLFVFCL